MFHVHTHLENQVVKDSITLNPSDEEPAKQPFFTQGIQLLMQQSSFPLFYPLFSPWFSDSGHYTYTLKHDVTYYIGKRHLVTDKCTALDWHGGAVFSRPASKIPP